MRGAPESITTDNGGEFVAQAMDAWAYRVSVKLDFIRLGRPVQNGYIESFNGCLRDECLNTEVFQNLGDGARRSSAGGAITISSGRTVRWRIEHRKNSRGRWA